MKNVDTIEKVLALAPNWLGDVAMCTPAFRALHRRFPEARLTIAARAAACALLEGLPWIDELVTLPARPSFGSMLQISRKLRPVGCDLAVVFPHSFRAALLARLTGAKQRVGHDRDGRRFLLTDLVQRPTENGAATPIYMAREYLDLVADLGCVDDDAGLELATTDAECATVRQYLEPGRPVIGLAPGAAFGPSKQWPAERFATVADELAGRTGAQIVLMTGPGEEDTREAVRTAASTPLIECHGGSPTIARLKATIACIDLLVSNDSGPRHVAIAFKKPVVCVMGSTSPLYTDSPWEVGKVLRVDVDCGPCHQPVCTTDHRCMTQIAPEAVVETALEYLPG